MEQGNLRPLQCPTCKRVYSQNTKDNYIAHLKTCGKGKYNCDNCDKKFFSQQTLYNHIRKHTLGAVHSCSVCNRNFDTNFQLVLHSRIHRDKSEREKDRLKCDYCSKTFAWKSSLSRHLQSHFGSETKSFFCECGKGFKNYTGCYSHKKTCIFGVKVTENVKNTGKLSGESVVHRCQFCNKGFEDRVKLNEHVVQCDPFPFIEDSAKQKSETEEKSLDQKSNADAELGVNEKEASLKLVSGKSKEICNTIDVLNDNKEKKVFQESIKQSASTDKQNNTVDKALGLIENEPSVRRTGRIRKPKQFPEFDVESPKYEKMLKLIAPAEKDNIGKEDKVIFFVDKNVKMNKTNKGIEVVILPVEDSSENEGKLKYNYSNKRKDNEVGKLESCDSKVTKNKANTKSSVKLSKARITLKQKTKEILKDKIKHGKFKYAKRHSKKVSVAVYPDEPPKCHKVMIKNEEKKQNFDGKESMECGVNLGSKLNTNNEEISLEETGTICQKEPPKCVKATIKKKKEQPSCSENKNDHSNDPDSMEKTTITDYSMEEMDVADTEDLSETLHVSKDNKNLSVHEMEKSEFILTKKKKQVYKTHYRCMTENCLKKFKTVKEIINHKKTSHGEYMRYVCFVCSKEFGTFVFYRTHLRMDHSDIESVRLHMKNTDIVITNTAENTNKKYVNILVCTKCGYRYKESEDPSHDCKPVGLLFFCPCCTFSTRYVEEITQHISIEHPGQCYDLRYKNQYVNLRSAPRLPGLQVDKSCTKCDQCDSQFETNKELMQHIEDKHANYPFACGFCMTCYGRKCTLNIHLKQHLRPQFKCEVCHKEFFEQFHLNRHMILHSKERPYQCDVCGNRYCDDKALKKHMLLKHVDYFRDSFPESSLGESDKKEISHLVCHICEKTFSMTKGLNRHMKTHNLKQLLKCAECGKTFGTKQDYNNHKRTHTMLNVSTKDTMTQVSDVPSKDKDRYKQIRKYEEGHPTGLPYSCSLCNKRFSMVKSINQHIRTVHMQDKDKNFTCYICEKGFPTKASFRNHLRLHTNSRPYRCRICHKRFKQVGHIREHMLIHGEAKLRCKLCGRHFKNRGLLRAHVILHSNTLPYKCPGEHCTSAFHSLFQLWEHFSNCVKSVRKESPLKCGLCEQVCNKDTIMLHYQCHEMEEHFKCDVCGVTFKTYQLLYFHKDDRCHFTETELSNTSKPHHYSANHNEPVCIKGISREDLMSQYDYIEEEDELPIGFAVENSTDIYKEHANKAGDSVENLSGELLGIAEQLTHMASGIQYKEIIIHGSDRIEEHTIETNIIEDNVEEIQTTSGGDTTQYKEIIIHAPHQAEDESIETMVLDEEGQEIKIKGESSTQIQDMSFHDDRKTEIVTYGHYVVEDNKELEANELATGTLNNTDQKSKIIQDYESKTHTENIVTREQTLDTASNTVNSKYDTHIEEITTEEVVEYSHPHLSAPFRFVDKSGNEIIVLVINEQGENVQVTNSEEILDTVMKNGDYSVIHNTDTDLVPDINIEDKDKLGNRSSNTHNFNKNLNTVDSEILETSPETWRQNKNQQKREVRNLDKILGTFDRNLDNSIIDQKAKVALKFYEERSNELPIKCSICPRGFRSVKARNFHEKTHLQNFERKYQCEECGAGFHTPNKLQIHQRIHTQERPHKCDQCGKCYSQPGHLQTHLRTHLKYYPFHCNLCDMKFSTNSNLKSHVKKSHQENQCCQCSSCDLYLKDEIDLKIHKLWHLSAETRHEFLSNCNGIADVQVGENICEQVKGYNCIKDSTKHPRKLKNYICETCGVSLKGEALFNAHQAVHNATATSLSCRYCDHVFTDRSALDTHMKNHAEYGIMCKICGSYVKEELMKNHLIRHENKFALNYQCKVCGKQIKTEYTFMRHVMSCNETEVDILLQGVNDHIKVEQAVA